MTDRTSSLFLERRGYRQRRLRDAARLLPILGAVLWAIPLLWPRGETGIAASSAILYIFGVWLVVAGLAFGVSRQLDDDSPAASRDPQSRDSEAK